MIKLGKYKQAFWVLIVVVIGLMLSKCMVGMKKEPAKKPQERIAPLVKTSVVQLEDVEMVVSGYGTVRPKREVTVAGQVSGRIIYCDDNFVNGGFFKKEQALVKIDPRDYEVAVENAEAEVARAMVGLEQEMAEAEVARVEWEQMNPDKEPTSSLVLRGPQIRQAKAQLKAAEALLARAKLDLERTVISMPFDGRVSQESVDVGQYLMAGGAIATVYATDVVEISVPIEDRELAWFDVAMIQNGKDSGAEAEVIADFAGVRQVWQGRVVRTAGQIDETSRMVSIVVEVEKPFEISDSRPPLVPGMFVEIKIKGNKLEDVIIVARSSIHNKNEVWIVNGDKLHIQKVEVARSDKKNAYIKSGLKAGDEIITSPIDVVTDKMDIRTQSSHDEVESK